MKELAPTASEIDPLGGTQVPLMPLTADASNAVAASSTKAPQGPLLVTIRVGPPPPGSASVAATPAVNGATALMAGDGAAITLDAPGVKFANAILTTFPENR